MPVGESRIGYVGEGEGRVRGRGTGINIMDGFE